MKGAFKSTNWKKICLKSIFIFPQGLPDVSVDKESACSAGDAGLIPGLGKFPGEGNGNPLLYSCLESPCTEKPGVLQSKGLQTVGQEEMRIKTEPDIKGRGKSTNQKNKMCLK